MDTVPCHDCGSNDGEPHDEECLAAEHAAMLRGDELAMAIHDDENCEECLIQKPPMLSECRCGDCCRHLIIEVSELDGQREPKIQERASPIYMPAELCKNRERVRIGFLLNGADGACVFLDQGTNQCTIYETRPLACRVFDCAQAIREGMIALDVLA